MKLKEIMSIIVDNSDPEKRKEENHSYYALFKDSMEICTKDPNDRYFYTVYKTGEATKHNKRSGVTIATGYVTSMLPDVDYVLYSNIPVVRAGYLIYDRNIISAKRLLADIFDSAVLEEKDLEFVSMTPHREENKVSAIEVKRRPYMIKMCSIGELVALNIDRKMVGIKSLPYMKSMRKAIYVYIVKESKLHNYIGSEDKIKTGNIIQDIIDSCHELYPEISMKWKNLNTKYLFY